MTTLLEHGRSDLVEVAWGEGGPVLTSRPGVMERDARDLTGQVIDARYRVEYELGRGGMGRVWSVQHVESRAHFALKTLEIELGQESGARERLSREARAASALRTRHVARVLDARTDYVHEGRPLPFLVMERLEGRTLEQWLMTRGALIPAQVLWVALQVGRALALAHAQGIVHRDLKPSNVFLSVDEDGTPLVKLCDFGIAKFTSLAAAALLTEGGGGTSAREVLGTPLYLAPELLRGAARATPATDQWALALTVFKALSGREYFASARTGPELVLRIAQDPLVPPSELVNGLPEEFDGWFAKSCSRVPEERFESVEAQVAALAIALREPEPSPVPITREAPPRPAPSARARSADPSPNAPLVRSRTRSVALFIALGWACTGTLWLLFAEAHPSSPAAPSATALDATVRKAAAVPRATAGVPAEMGPPSEPTAKALVGVGPPRASVARSPAAPFRRAVSEPPGAELPAPAKTEATRPAREPCRRSADCSSGLCVAERCR